MNAGETAIREVAERVHILHENAFLIDGESRVFAPTARSLTEESKKEPTIVQAIAGAIYATCYTRPSTQGRAYAHVTDLILKQDFIEELSRFNSTVESWAPNYKFVAMEQGLVRAEGRPGKTTLVPPELFDGPDERGFGRVRQNREDATGQPAWYHVYGSDGIPAYTTRVLRCYWNVSAEGAIPLLATLTKTLNARRIPFQFKTLNDPQLYERADSAVLYLPAFTWHRARGAITDVHALVKPYLRAPTPLFTRRLAAGLGAAEDPAVPGTSFGTHRSNILAAALWDAWERQLEAEDRIAHLLASWTTAGLSLEHPHLNPGSSSEYELAVGVAA